MLIKLFGTQTQFPGNQRIVKSIRENHGNLINLILRKKKNFKVQIGVKELATAMQIHVTISIDVKRKWTLLVLLKSSSCSKVTAVNWVLDISVKKCNSLRY